MKNFKLGLSVLLVVAAVASGHGHASHAFTRLGYTSWDFNDLRETQGSSYTQLMYTYDVAGMLLGPVDITLARSKTATMIYDDIVSRGQVMAETEDERWGHLTMTRIPTGQLRAPSGVPAMIPPPGIPIYDTGWHWIHKYQCDYAWNWDLDSTESVDYAWPGVDSPPANCYLFETIADPDNPGEFIDVYAGIIRMPQLSPVDGEDRLAEMWLENRRKLGTMGPVLSFEASSGNLRNFKTPPGPEYHGVPDKTNSTIGQQADFNDDGVVGGADFGAFAGQYGNLVGTTQEGYERPASPDPATWDVQP